KGRPVERHRAAVHGGHHGVEGLAVRVGVVEGYGHVALSKGPLKQKTPVPIQGREPKTPAVPPWLPAIAFGRPLDRAPSCPRMGNGVRPRPGLVAPFGAFTLAAPEGFSAKAACLAHTCARL